VTVTEIVAARRRVTLSTICRVGGKVVVEGDALVMTTTSQPREAVPECKQAGLVV
jgi:3-hydroxybutyryl-CoA dehydratase